MTAAFIEILVRSVSARLSNDTGQRPPKLWPHKRNRAQALSTPLWGAKTSSRALTWEDATIFIDGAAWSGCLRLARGIGFAMCEDAQREAAAGCVSKFTLGFE